LTDVRIDITDVATQTYLHMTWQRVF